MMVTKFSYPSDFKEVKGDNYIPEILTVTGCNWCKKKDESASRSPILGLTFLMASRNVNVEELAFQVLFEVNSEDEGEMRLISHCPLLEDNMSVDLRDSYRKIFEDNDGSEDGEVKRSNGVTDFVFENGTKSFPYIMKVVMDVNYEMEEIHTRMIYLTRDLYMKLNTYISSFRSLHWLHPNIFQKNIYDHATSDIEIQSIMHIGTAVPPNDMTYSIFEIYPKNPVNPSCTIGIVTGEKKKNRILKKTISDQEFFTKYKNTCIVSPSNMISVQSPEFRIYLIVQTPEEELVKVFYMSKETASRLNFFDWDKIIYL